LNTKIQNRTIIREWEKSCFEA